MKRRYFRDTLDSFRDYDRTPSGTTEHQGVCACGVVTSRMGYSSAEPWQCHACGEAALRAIYDRAMKTKP